MTYNGHMHFPSPDSTIWHVTFGTYGTRLHGGIRPTVDRRHNVFGDPFLDAMPRYEQVESDRLAHPPRFLTVPQQEHVEGILPATCQRGGWNLLAYAVAVDHIHLVLDAAREAEGKTIRTLLKRWLSQALQKRFGIGAWWAEGGSNKVVDCPRYLESVLSYVGNHTRSWVHRPGDGPARPRV